MKTCPNWETLCAWEQGERQKTARDPLSGHLEACPSCRGRLEELRGLREWFGRLRRSDSCPSWLQWARWAETAEEGDLAGNGLDNHADQCSPCRQARDLFQAMWQRRDHQEHSLSIPGPRVRKVFAPVLERSSGSTAFPPGSAEPQLGLFPGSAGILPAISLRRFAACAAGILLAALIGWGVFQMISQHNGVDVYSEIPGVQVQSTEGGRWRWEPGSEKQVAVESGEVHFSVEPGSPRFSVKTPAGTVRVLGTRFSVRLVPIPELEPGNPPQTAAVVALEDGRVLLENNHGTFQLQETGYGLLVPGSRPGLLERGTAPLSPQEIQTYWTTLLDALHRNDQRQAAWYTAALAIQKNSALPPPAYWQARSAQEQDRILNVLRSLGFSDATIQRLNLPALQDRNGE